MKFKKNWENIFVAFILIERKADGSFDRGENGQKKVRFLENWKNVKKKSVEELEKHFENKNAGLALLTGKKNNVTVIDFDTKDNDLMLNLYEVAPTQVIETEKGFHFYYKYSDNPIFYTRSNAFGQSIDCRNDGGVVFCPPTPNYVPWKKTTINEITVEGIKLLEKFSTNMSTSVKGEKFDLKNTTTRNDNLFRMACGWVESYNNEEVWTRMVKANKEFVKGELGMRELETIFRQAIGYKKTGVKPEEDEKYKLVSLDKVKDSMDFDKRYSTGFGSLDEVMREDSFFKSTFQGGFALGEFVALAGRPGNGKTLLASQITTSLQKSGIKSLWFSYEANIKKLKRIFIRQEADLSMVTSIEVTEKTPLLGNIDWIEEQLKRSIAKFGTKLVVIDNLDFLEIRNDKKDNYSKNQQAYLSTIVSELSKIAIQFNIILILIAHVRKPNTTTIRIKRPHLYDIAGTSALERLCSFGFIIEREQNPSEDFSDRSFLYLDKNRESGVRKKIILKYKDGKLKEEASELLKYINDEMEPSPEMDSKLDPGLEAKIDSALETEVS